ncbi:Lipase-like PAD4 [Camellia lanceoleosa]|uniref:Lipase-like PAD4 n=1 Tax=Camellia lanceoleosa TaxID=1840588 RepID=A0ACC0J454_9ERIC|nr:Lipase-like PAD4 [Camellia lanceoleosa]
MEAEASSFETSEILATFLGSTPLLSDSWNLCRHANSAAPHGFLVNRIAGVAYVAFSGVQTVAGLDSDLTGCRNLVALDCDATAGLFSELRCRGGEAEEEPVMVHAGMLNLFLSMFKYTDFQFQIFELMKQSKSIVLTGHSIGGTIASLSTLYLLSYLQSISSPLTSVLCFTFGSPLLGNESLSRAILHERWGSNFCHVVSKHDIVPRLLLAPLSPLTPHLHSLLQYYHFSMKDLTVQNIQLLPNEMKNEIFLLVLAYAESSAKLEGGQRPGRESFWPFGSYVFCTNKGAICVDNEIAVVKLLHLMFSTASASSSVEDHLKYEEYVGKFLSWQFLKTEGLLEGEFLDYSSYEAGVRLALQSSEISSHEPAFEPAIQCLKTAKRMGRTPNLNSANLAIALSKITPLRAQVEWYKKTCDEFDENRMGYYDTFKLRGASKRDDKVNMNRIKLARFWDDLIHMLDTNQLPHDFQKRAKFVNASHFYKLLVEPLDIAEYYRTGMHRVKGHYVKHGRERRYEIFDRWWRNRKVGDEENNNRSKFASLTQDSCFWARVEEAREWIENTRSERDTRKLSMLLENIDKFEQYASGIVERKEVSTDVLAENSSYHLWVKEWGELKSQLQQFPPQFPGFFEGNVVP